MYSVLQDYLDSKVNDFGSVDQELDELLRDIEKYVLRGGKFNRSALIRLAYSLQGGSNKDIVRIAGGFELIHKFILVHDDIVDRDILRYGGPTLEKVYSDRYLEKFRKTKSSELYGIGMAMVGGDVIHVLASQLILESDFSTKNKTEVLMAINRCIIETVAGWKIHTNQNLENIEAVDKEKYFSGLELVSAMYSVVWPLRIGQILNGDSNQKWLQPLEDYGLRVGFAFQLQDDILGMFGDIKQTGKPVGNDYREGKKTLLILDAYENASSSDKKYISKTLGKNISDSELKKIQHIIVSTGSLQKSKDLAIEHAKMGIKSLDSFGKNVDLESVRILKEIAAYMAEREY